MPDTKFSQNATLERDLAISWQLPRRELARHRAKLSEGEDWWKQGRVIAYSNDGIRKMSDLLGLGDESHKELKRTPKSRQVAIKSDRRILNPRLIEAIHENQRILVRVRDQSLYTPGMLVFIRPEGNGWTEAMKPKRRGVPNLTPEEREQYANQP